MKFYCPNHVDLLSELVTTGTVGIREEPTPVLGADRPSCPGQWGEKHHVSRVGVGAEEEWTPPCSSPSALCCTWRCGLSAVCGLHLQPHYESSTFQKHELVAASAKLQENICSHHNKVKVVFCSVCYPCAAEEHKDHDTVPAAAERTERQRELGPSAGDATIIFSTASRVQDQS